MFWRVAGLSYNVATQSRLGSADRPGGGYGYAGPYQCFRISLLPVLMADSTQAFRRYLQLWLVVVLTFLFLMAALNYLVDPYGMFDTDRVNGLNASKPAAGATRAKISTAFPGSPA